MKKEKLNKRVSLIVCLVIGGFLAYLYVGLRDFSGQDLMGKYRMLCDAFTIPGLLFLMLGLLMTISSHGALDGVTYVVSYGLKMLIPGRHDKQERFYDYVQRKREKNKGKSFGYLYLTGIIYLAAALLFLILFYSLYNK